MDHHQQALLNYVGNKLSSIVTLDKRSLALFRVLISLVTIVDLVDRFGHISAMYTDEGIMPRELTLKWFYNPYWISVHMMSGSEFVIQCLFMFHFFIAFLLMIGYRTRLMTVINWFLVYSLQNRNLPSLHSGDPVQRLLLFWCIFLPLGDVFSMDSAFRSAKTHESSTRRKSYGVFNVASVGLTVQVLIIYLMAHAFKTGDVWRTRGIASWMALNIDALRTPVGDAMLAVLPMWVHKFLTFSVLYWQGYGPLMYFVPFYNDYFRAFVVLGFTAMHAGFGMAMSLDQFTWATLASVSSLLPGKFWDDLFGYINYKNRKPVEIYYVEGCKTCRRTAFVLSQFLPSNSKVIEEKTNPVFNNEDRSQFLGVKTVDHQRNVKMGPEIFAAVAQGSALLFPVAFLARIPLFKKLAVKICRLLHSHPTSTMSKNPEPNDSDGLSFVVVENNGSPARSRNEFKIEQPDSMHFFRGVGFVVLLFGNLFLAFLIYIVIGWNYANLGVYWLAPPSWSRTMVFTLELDQSWSMFAPSPPDSSSWYNIEGILEDDVTKIELFANGGLHSWEPMIPHTFDKPVDFQLAYRDQRWLKWFEWGFNTQDPTGLQETRLNFGRWICRNYNTRHPEKRLYRFKIYYVYERYDMQKLDGSRHPKGMDVMWDHICFDRA